MASEKLKIGNAMPSFKSLPATDGMKYSSSDFSDKKILVVVFSCNHCPYVKAYEERMIVFQRDYSAKGLQLIAINSNETVNYPQDNFEEMVKNAKKKNFNFVYLRDDDQSVADVFGATHTPEFFVFDEERKLRYHGKLDDNWQNPDAVKEKYLQDAVDAILAGKEVLVPETFSIGCTIKWR
ncbi:MAG: thioredoxin family protein [Bacteroidota bacterium]|nr:thioredoxin family protein [Bacteroidota bacterium]